MTVRPANIRDASCGQPGKVGKLFEARLDSKALRGRELEYYPGMIQGLYLALLQGIVAKIEITVGTDGGNSDTRTFMLTHSGAWLSIAGWDNVKVVVEEVDDTTARTGTQVGYTWTTLPPRPPTALLFVQAIDVADGITVVPNGAAFVALEDPDPAWIWTTSTSVAAFAIVAPQTGLAELEPVLGAQYTPSVSNLAVWTLREL